jgi:hypothetical protein
MSGVLCARAEKRERSVAHVGFRSRGVAVDVGQICLGLAPGPSFLRAICSIPSFELAKFAAAFTHSPAFMLVLTRL